MGKKSHFQFHVGAKVVSVEGGKGPMAPEYLESVDVAIHPASESRQNADKSSFNRDQVAEIGLSFLEVAHRLQPTDTYNRSQVVSADPLGKKMILPLSEASQEDLKQFLSSVGGELVRKRVASFELLRRRMHILHRMQFLLERVDDDAASQLDLLLTIMENAGSLPMRLGLAAMPDDVPGTTH